MRDHLRDRELLLVRHGESEWNAVGRWQGQGDPPLSARGRAQVEAVAERLGAEPIVRVYSSDLRRAYQTAAAIAAPHGLQPRVDARLRELNVGRWTGLSRVEIEAREPELLARFQSEDPDVRPGGGESRSEIRARVRGAVLESMDAAPPQGLVVFVAHLGTLRALVPGAQPHNAEVLRTRVAAIAALTRSSRAVAARPASTERAVPRSGSRRRTPGSGSR